MESIQPREPDLRRASTKSTQPHPEMICLNGGTYAMGSEQFYADEGPVHAEEIEPFWLDRRPVTNTQFRAFVDDTGYVTTAERSLPVEEYPELSDADRAPGSLVFHPTSGAVDLTDWRQWWRWCTGAQWRHPFGPNSGIELKLDHPVVQVSFEDSSTYAEWAGKRLPSEAEWEFAARGGLASAVYSWGDEPFPDGRLMANFWQGKFPHLNTGAKGWQGTSSVGEFPANGYGFLDMIGNVWEWTSTPYAGRHELSACCVAGDEWQSHPELASSQDGKNASARRVLKGGSHLCAPEYCLRYRPAARSPQSDDSSTTHIGFRCAGDA